MDRLHFTAQKISKIFSLNSRAKRIEGFSLLEVILAIGILATIGIITINVLSAQIATRKKLSEMNTERHALNATLSHIIQDLQGAYLSDPSSSASLNLYSRPVVPQFSFKKENLIFFTQSFHSYIQNSTQSNQAFIRYTIKDNSNDPLKKLLIRIVDTDFVESIEQDGIGISQILMDNLENFKVEFWDGNKFREDWDSNANDTQKKLPKLVKIHLSSYSIQENKNQNTQNSKEPTKQTYALDTIVYLPGSAGQNEANTPQWGEYKWQ